jgi:hypothetical protein
MSALVTNDFAPLLISFSRKLVSNHPGSAARDFQRANFAPPSHTEIISEWRTSASGITVLICS